MRYLGNKTRLLTFIDSVIEKYGVTGESFIDFFAGTASVADHFKDRYEIIANDVMYFSAVIARAKVKNSREPEFSSFKEFYGEDPFSYLNRRVFQPDQNYFIYNNYSPVGDRNYFTPDNAAKIDGIRIFIEESYGRGLFDENEYSYLLACLLQAVQKVANTSGTYQAFFKFLESRALKELILAPLEMELREVKSEKNRVVNIEANKLARVSSADIAYIDPPYTTTQYANSYHMLETIARYDSPEIFGKTGRRKNRILSDYSNRSRAVIEFEDLLRQLRCRHVLISYSNQSIIPLDDLTELTRKFALDGKVHVEMCDYREYSTNNPSYKGNGKQLTEAIIYFEKDLAINKSPLNYSGSKDQILDKITRHFPKRISTFVDAMGGAFNVGANVVADSVVYNEINQQVFEIMQYQLLTDKDKIIADVQMLRDRFGLTKAGKDAYLEARSVYNDFPDPRLLFVLQIYAFQNMLRFNGSGRMNTPVGNNELNGGTLSRIRNFEPKTPNYELILGSYRDLDVSRMDNCSLFYFDPPYFLSTAEYNDGRRGKASWDLDHEIELLNHLTDLDLRGYRFMLSNLIEHKGKTHHVLRDWVDEHSYRMIEVGETGKKYPRKEVIVVNYSSTD